MIGRTFLGRYESVRLLGEGGMGKVYLARQTDLERNVVIKVMHDHIAADPKFRERFQRETLLMARFQHPYAVTLYDASLNDPQGPCIVMEYIRGISLDTLLQRNLRLNAGRVSRLLGQLCEALQAAHDEGIIHRDLKPANLMVVDPDTPYEKIKVMDFGLAKLLDDRSTLRLAGKVSDTGADFAVGTPGYISPEQVRGEELDHRSDLYSVGVILFELLTGRLPFTRDETMDVLLAHATEAPPRFADVAAIGTVPPAIEDVVMACLAKNPAERPSTGRELAERFETGLASQFETAPAPVAVDSSPLSENRDTPTQQCRKPESADPHAVIHRMEAWMPDTIASYKLRGFVQDLGGEVVESVPGLIRVRLEDAGSGLSWFGFRRKASTVNMELRLERTSATQTNLLHITVVMNAPDRKTALTQGWRDRCNQIFCELRGYLAGSNVS